MLHPNLVVMDAESELTDKTRWMKMEPPDVIAQIMGLDLTNAASRVAYTVTDEDEDEEEEHPDLLDQSLWDKENDDTVKPPVTSTKDATETDDETVKPIMITSIVALHKALKSGAEVLVGDDIWDAGVEPTTTPAELATPSSHRDISAETRLLLAALKREVLLLRNELNFELFLKQQHLQHIGRLHREHVLDSSVEAERQQLVKKTEENNLKHNINLIFKKNSIIPHVC